MKKLYIGSFIFLTLLLIITQVEFEGNQYEIIVDAGDGSILWASNEE